MNIVVEPKANCLATLRVELEPDRVLKQRSVISRDFQKHAKIPGFRPGKAPQALVEKRFESQIQEELTNSLLRTTLEEAIKEKKLRVISVSKVDDVKIQSDNSLSFTATLITSPEFELPDYTSFEIEIPKQTVEDSNVDSVLDGMARQHATYEPIEGRPLAAEDFAVLTLACKSEGKPCSEAIPDCPARFRDQSNCWVRLSDQTSIAPGFVEEVIGLSVGDKKDFSLTLPADFNPAELAGKSIDFQIEVNDAQAQKVPAIDDALAELIDPGNTLEQVRTKIFERMQGMEDERFERTKRQAALAKIVGQVTCDLPAHMVNHEAQNILRDIVEENHGRGISDDELKSHEEEILGVAKQTAEQHVRSNFVLERIAEKESLEATQEELINYVANLANQYRIPIKKFVSDLRKRGGIERIRDQILSSKALDLLVSNATVREVSPAPAADAEKAS